MVCNKHVPLFFSHSEVSVKLSGSFSSICTLMLFDVLSLFSQLFGCYDCGVEGQVALSCDSILSLEFEVYLNMSDFFSIAIFVQFPHD